MQRDYIMNLPHSAERTASALLAAEQGVRASVRRVASIIEHLNWKQKGLLVATTAVVVGVAVYWFAFRAAPVSYVTAEVT